MSSPPREPVSPPGSDAAAPPAVYDAVRRIWGYDTLRPLQAEAIQAGLEHRDSLIVMPTGGGKSLCYQVPPLVARRVDVVVSPLISLMKDQVDGLTQSGYPAAALHSALDAEQRREVERRFDAGEIRLLFVSPERLGSPWLLQRIERGGVRAFAIDEAHCISHWGHDFRPEYRQLAKLRERFPHASVHAFTATATPQVRDDIVRQLQLRDPLVLVGGFDRPNLVYRVVPRSGLKKQLLDAIQRHVGEASIVYCLSRRQTEQVAEYLVGVGVRAAAYHGGMSGEQRADVQEAFAQERLDVVVATIAFGMGVDRSNVRLVAHAVMPKSIEHYQQETGRAGRDGLEAECILFYSKADAWKWETLLLRSAEEAGHDDPLALVEPQRALLRDMQQFCGSLRCRHRQLVEYFGQRYEQERCNACDVCLGEVEELDDATRIAQMILSAVARTGQRFGVNHVVDVLRGAKTQRVTELGHDQLSVYGLLAKRSKQELAGLVHQLVDQQVLERTPGEMPTLVLNAESLRVMRGEQTVRLAQPSKRLRSRGGETDDAWRDVDPELFARLKAWRKQTAEAQAVPPYVVSNDRTLRELARRKPRTLEALRGIHGLGERKIAAYGEALLHVLLGEAYDDSTADLPSER